MKRESHKLLGMYLLENLQGLPAQRHKKAFLFGCIQPDMNVFTYLKGSMRVQMLRGHNFKNSEICVCRTIQKLQKDGQWNIKDYYRLGKLIHYISDAFTYPHNDFYEDSILEHRVYEGELNTHFKNNIKSPKKAPLSSTGNSVMDSVRLIHKQYSEALNDIQTDMEFIIRTAEIVFNGLISETAAVA